MEVRVGAQRREFGRIAGLGRAQHYAGVSKREAIEEPLARCRWHVELVHGACGPDPSRQHGCDTEEADRWLF